MPVSKISRILALAAVACLPFGSQCLADDTGNYFADQSCRGLSPDEIENAKRDDSLLFQCRRTQLDLDMKSGLYEPPYHPTPNTDEFKRCGWKDLNGDFPRNTIIVVQEIGDHSWVLHPKYTKPAPPYTPKYL